MTTVDAPTLERESATDPDGEGTDGSGRGTTTISPAVFEKLASRAAAEVSGVEGAVQTGLDRWLPWTAGTRADASAEVTDDGIDLELTFNVAYPEPVRQVAQAVRRHVTERIRWMTGCPVRKIDITVPELAVAARRPGRVR